MRMEIRCEILLPRLCPGIRIVLVWDDAAISYKSFDVAILLPFYANCMFLPIISQG